MVGNFRSDADLTMEITDSVGMHTAIYGQVPGDGDQLDPTEPLVFLGGTYELQKPTVDSDKSGFVGCIAQLMGSTKKGVWSTVQLQQQAEYGSNINVCTS